jgi:hypothetical protein
MTGTLEYGSKTHFNANFILPLADHSGNPRKINEVDPWR